MSAVDFASFVDELASRSGAAILPFFRTSIASVDKSRGGVFDPVTEADRAAETVMRRMITQTFPGHGIIGEEFGNERQDAEFVWVLDPIDGTRAFVAGRPLFGTLVALLDEGRPVLGIIDQPIIGDRWVGASQRPTLFNGQPAQTRRCAAVAEARVGTTSPQAFSPETFAAFERLRTGARDTLYGGDCHNYGLLASGHLDLVVEAGLQLYDFAALVPVIEGAGGRMTDWQGRSLDRHSDGRVVAAGDASLIPEALAKLSG